MSFDRKITFPAETIEVSGMLYSFQYDFAIFTSSDFWNLYFVSVSTTSLQGGRPRVTWLVEAQHEFASAPPPPTEALLIIGTDLDDVQIPASVWIDKYVAIGFESGAVLLLRTFKGPWVMDQENAGRATSPVTGKPEDIVFAANYELTVARDNDAGDSTALTSPVNLVEITQAEFDAGVVPAAFGPREIPEKTVWAELSDSGSSIDFNLALGESGREETLSLKTRYLPTILNRRFFVHEGSEYRILNIDRIGRKQFLNITGVNELETQTDG